MVSLFICGGSGAFNVANVEVLVFGLGIMMDCRTTFLSLLRAYDTMLETAEQLAADLGGGRDYSAERMMMNKAWRASLERMVMRTAQETMNHAT